MAQRDYAIKDYAMIGNCETAALVNPDGGIDWLCLPAFDSPSVFGALLDRERAGTFVIRPAIDYQSERAYLDESAILITRFVTAAGVVELTDFFVIAREPQARFYDFTSLYPTQKLIRMVQVTSGQQVPIALWCRARPGYGREKALWHRLATDPGGFASASITFYTNMPVEEHDGDLTGTLVAERGQRYFTVLDYSDSPVPPDRHKLQQWFAVTHAFWQEWQVFNYYRGRYEKIIRRSAVTLKLLTYARTGAFVAAATTSLPERIGGDQNWDYRYLWVRDTALFISAFFRLGYSGEAKAFFNFIVERCATHVGSHGGKRKRHDHPLQVLYPIREGTSTEERTLDYLAGYRLSRPVRIGNRAARQFQLDNPAYLLQSFSYFRHTGGTIDAVKQAVIDHLTCHVLHHWQQPDHGIWEVPEQAHYTHSKCMAWVALKQGQRVSSLATEPLEDACAAIAEDIMQGALRRNNGRAYLAKSYDSSDVDASALLAFTTGLLPPDLARLQRQEIERQLASGPFFYRNGEKKHVQNEGAFLMCSFWWINHLIREGELQRAEAALEQMIDHAQPLGLLAEEIDPSSGAFLGNFPQAFSHLSLIETILNLEESKRHPSFHGLPDDQKFTRSIGATVAVRGVLSGFLRVPKTFKLVISKRSKWAASPHKQNTSRPK